MLYGSQRPIPELIFSFDNVIDRKVGATKFRHFWKVPVYFYADSRYLSLFGELLLSVYFRSLSLSDDILTGSFEIIDSFVVLSYVGTYVIS